MFWQLPFYSNWMFFLNCIYVNRSWNAMLYLSNWGCLFGNLILMVRNPLHLLRLVETYLPWAKDVPLVAMHITNQLTHMLPLYLFYARQTLAETLSWSSIAGGAALIAAYLFLVPNDVLLQMYALPRETLYGMAAVATVVAVLGRRLLLNKGL